MRKTKTPFSLAHGVFPFSFSRAENEKQNAKQQKQQQQQQQQQQKQQKLQASPS
jgi:hypothetical protein